MTTEKRGTSTCGFSKLPEKCISYLFSFTSPRDVCRLSLVCKFFLAAVQIDLLWESFLPPDVDEILSRATDPVDYSSKKEVYFRLCQPLLVDDGKLSFQLERSTGKKTYMLSPETMFIPWITHPRHWRWISLPHSRFSKQAELVSICWLEINGSINSRLLSQKTKYTTYMIYKLNPDSFGLDSNSQKVLIRLGAHSQDNRVSLEPDEEEEEEDKQIQLREDGWLEMKLGEIYNDQGNEGDIEIKFLDIEELHWKKGFVFAGYEMRPMLVPGIIFA